MTREIPKIFKVHGKASALIVPKDPGTIRLPISVKGIPSTTEIEDNELTIAIDPRPSALEYITIEKNAVRDPPTVIHSKGTNVTVIICHELASIEGIARTVNTVLRKSSDQRRILSVSTSSPGLIS
jgi:hypothetical protein